VDFLRVLDSERSLYAAQDALVQSDQTESTDLVQLYKALGGGWQDQSNSVLSMENSGSGSGKHDNSSL
jgi:outer membrane protein TolC